MVLLFLLHSRVRACQTIEYEGQGVIAHEQADFYKKRKEKGLGLNPSRWKHEGQDDEFEGWVGQWSDLR